jgi:hypothetical protein
MKKRIPVGWVEFFRTGRLFKIIEVSDNMPDYIPEPSPLDHISKKLKKPKKAPPAPKPKVYHWELSVSTIDGQTSSLVTVEPDTDDYCGEDAYDHLLEWYQCSNNPSFVFRYADGLHIFIRSYITKISVVKKEKV